MHEAVSGRVHTHSVFSFVILVTFNAAVSVLMVTDLSTQGIGGISWSMPQDAHNAARRTLLADR